MQRLSISKMANLLEHLTVSLLVLALTSGLWYGGEGRTCRTPIPFSSCVVDHPASCISICRSGLYFPPYFYIEAFCEEKRQGNYCTCIWECDGSAANSAAQHFN